MSNNITNNKVPVKDPLKYEVLNQVNTIAIFGDCGSGKTALSYSIIDLFKDKMKIYFIKHPKPDVIEAMGYHNIYSLEELEYVENALIYADEPQLWTSIYDNKTNSIIAKMCSLARQKNIKLIISSSDTRVFSRHNEAYFDIWLVKDVDYSMVKNGSMIKNAIKAVSILDASGFRLPVNEFVFWSRKLYTYNRRYKFDKPKYFTDKHSKPYQISDDK